MSHAAASSAPVRHPSLIISIHWLTFGAILGAVVLVLVRELVEGRATRLALLDLHRSLGVLVIGLTLLRLLIRFANRKSLPDHSLPQPMALMAALGHLAIYLALFAIPLLGWAQTSARGLTLQFFGLFPLPALIATDTDFAETLADAHEYAAWLLLVLVATHAGAALWHHYIRRDGVLTSMLPVAARSDSNPPDRPLADGAPG